MSSPSLPASSPRGALIVIEGLDRSGKSTQCQRLQQRLEDLGVAVKAMRFPNRTTPIGQAIDTYLRSDSQLSDHTIHLLFSANRWEFADPMRADIAAGTTLIVDRYYYSGVAYSVAKGRADLSLEWARAPEVGLPRPDLCLFLNIDARTAATRGGFGEERYEDKELQGKVRNVFDRLMRSADGIDISVVNAGQDVETVQGAIWAKVEEVLRGRETIEPLRTIS